MKTEAIKKHIKMMDGMSGSDYAAQEAWDILDASNVLGYIASMCMNETHEPDDMQSLANIMKSLMEFINGEIQEMVTAAKQGDSYQSKSANGKIENNYFYGAVTLTSDKAFAQVKQLDLSYVKSLQVDIPETKLAVKYVSKNVIAHPVFIWGDEKKTDLEAEYFTKSSDFWDKALEGYERPLTWEHGQDEKFAQFESNPVIGKTVKFYDDDIARWAESVITTDKQYRKYIDQFIEEKRLGYSSDSAPQYVQRVQQGKSVWLKSWPWFGGSLTASPCEPRMKQFTPEFLKSLGITLPDVPVDETAWQSEMMTMDLDFLKAKYNLGD